MYKRRKVPGVISDTDTSSVAVRCARPDMMRACAACRTLVPQLQIKSAHHFPANISEGRLDVNTINGLPAAG